MADQVIKDDGRRELFDAEKIRDSIEDAAEEAGLSEEESEKLAEEIGAKTVVMSLEKDLIPTREIKDFILEELDIEAPEVSKAWREYEKTKEE